MERLRSNVAQISRQAVAARRMLFRWRGGFGLAARTMPQLATAALANGAANEMPSLGALQARAGARQNGGDRDGDRTAGVMEPRQYPAPQHSIGGPQRGMARKLAIQLQRPTCHTYVGRR
jgi:hypothetical protein